MALIATAMALAAALLSVPADEPVTTPPTDAPASTPEEPSPAIEPQAIDPLGHLVVVRVELDGSEGITSLLHTEITTALREAHIDPELPEGAPLEVVVSPEGLGAYDVVFSHRGQTVRSWSCPCSGEELRARLARDAVAVWNEIVATSAPAPPASTPLASSRPQAANDPDTDRHERGRGLWTTGVATTSVGTALVVGMVALLAADAAADRDRSAAMLGLMGGGMAVAATGVTLWSIGARQRKRSRLSLGSVLRTGGATVLVGGRF